MPTSFRQVKNNAYSTVASAPSPATSGTSLSVASGHGARFSQPGNGFWATVFGSAYENPDDDANAEIVLVTGRSTDAFTITRAQLGTPARTIVVGDKIRQLIVDQQIGDIHTAIVNLENGLPLGAWTTTWDPAIGNLTVGNGTANHRYVKSGRIVIARLEFTLGSTSAVVGNMFFTLPVTAASYGGTTLYGNALFSDPGVGEYTGTVEVSDANTAIIYVNWAGSNYVTMSVVSSTVPFTWATGDKVSALVIYEAAA